MARNPELAQRHITRPHWLLVRAGSRSRASPEWAWLRLQGYSGARSRMLFSVAAPFNPAAAI